MLSKRGRSRPNVHGNIKNTPTRDPDESGLGMRRFLEMQTTKGAFHGRHRCGVLNKDIFKTKILDDLGVNLKPARAMGMTTIKVVDPIHR